MDRHLYKAMRADWEEGPPLKNFTAKCKNLEIMKEYSGSVDLDEDYWSKWDKKEYTPTHGSMVDHKALKRVAVRLGYKDMKKVDFICGFLEHGADLGVEEEGRLPSKGDNNATCYEYGDRVADSLQAGLNDGYLCGPLTRSEVDAIWPEGVKVSPMMVRLKPNGSARIIMDMSWPRKVYLGGGAACSPNEGMKNYQEYEKPEMTTDEVFRRAMYWAGWPVEVAKTDWSVAYKHVSVCSADHKFQLVEFCGRFFVETALTFGGCNSPTLYNMVAKLLIDLAALESGLDLRHSCQQLDDNCVVATTGSLVLWKYLKSYRAIAEEIGVQLAPEDDPAKAFPPQECGEILGIEYNGTERTWIIPEAKGLRILAALGDAIRTRSIRNDAALSLAGKLNHYSGMVHGKFNRCLIIHLGNVERADDHVVCINKQAMVCLVWWLLQLRVLQGCGGRKIPIPEDYLVSTALVINTDAAGGASSKEDQGWGVVNLSTMEWARGSWPKFILKNSVHMGAQWGRRLSVLEGFTGVLSVPLWAREIQEAGGAALMIDNLGFVFANTSGCSTDEVIWTLSKCLATLAEGLGVQIRVFHTGRRTSLGDKVADDLSKGKVGQVMEDLPGSKNISD